MKKRLTPKQAEKLLALDELEREPLTPAEHEAAEALVVSGALFCGAGFYGGCEILPMSDEVAA